MRTAIIVPFQSRRRLKPKPAKALLREDVRLSVQRSIQRLPILGEHNPDGALLVGELIDGWLHVPPRGGRKKDQPQRHKAADGKMRVPHIAPKRKMQAVRCVTPSDLNQTSLAFAFALGYDPGIFEW